MKDLHGKTAVVTGGGSGIGRSIVIALAKAGMNIVVSDLRLPTAETVREEAKALGVQAVAVQTDVSKHEFVVELADKAYGRFGSVEVLVNNAGVSWRPWRSVLDATMSDWKFVIDVNIWGVIHGLDVFLPRMEKQLGEKHIVNTSSLAGIAPVSGHTPYSGSKAFVTAISESMADELASEGFGVTCLHPSMVRTNVVQNSEAMRTNEDRGENRTFRPIISEKRERRMQMLSDQYIDAEAVGEMVRDAIQRNQLYLHTHPMLPGYYDERAELMYGEGTFGRA